LDGGSNEDEKHKKEEERIRWEKEQEEAKESVGKEQDEVEASVARREATRKKTSYVDPVARELLTSRARIEDAKRSALSASSGGAENNDNDDNGDANVVGNKEGTAATQDTGR
jgi:hypothetical protein